MARVVPDRWRNAPRAILGTLASIPDLPARVGRPVHQGGKAIRYPNFTLNSCEIKTKRKGAQRRPRVGQSQRTRQKEASALISAISKSSVSCSARFSLRLVGLCHLRAALIRACASSTIALHVSRHMAVRNPFDWQAVKSRRNEGPIQFAALGRRRNLTPCTANIRGVDLAQCFGIARVKRRECLASLRARCASKAKRDDKGIHDLSSFRIAWCGISGA